MKILAMSPVGRGFVSLDLPLQRWQGLRLSGLTTLETAKVAMSADLGHVLPGCPLSADRWRLAAGG